MAIAASCEKVPLVAPTESSITLTVSTTTLPINGTAQVIATVIEQAGTPVHNGTLVTFTMSGVPSTAPPSNQSASGPIVVMSPNGTNSASERNATFDTVAVGSFEPSDAATQNGRAVTTFRAGTRSGKVNIGAISGGAAATTIEVNIGGAAAGQVAVRAEPSAVPTTGGTSQITAFVADAAGNALPGAPVVFTATNGSLSSNSAVTDANGEARVTLTTNRETVVRAQVGAASDEVTVRAVSTGVSIALTNATEQPSAGVATSFTVTPLTGTGIDTDPVRNVVVDFGDGSSVALGAITAATPVSHVFARSGQYRVTATLTNANGFTSSSSLVINVIERAPLTVTLTASVLPNRLVDFTATASVPAGTTGLTYYWSFGDGTSAITTGGLINHLYPRDGTFTASVTVRASNGQEGYAERVVRVVTQ